MLGQTTRPLTRSTMIHRCGEVVAGWRAHAEETPGMEAASFFAVQAQAVAASVPKNREQTGKVE